MRWLGSTLLVLLTGCSESSLEMQLIEAAKAAPASSGDYWLVKHGLGGPGKVALVFGMVDDSTFCEELAALYMKRYPADVYTCQPAN